MDYGYLGFLIHKIHNPWISNGFGFTTSKPHGFRMDLVSPKSKIGHLIHGFYGFHRFYMDLILISVLHMDYGLDLDL